MTLVENNDRCCSCNFPDIPANWLLFADFAFMFATTVVYFADIVTDIITLQMYFERGWYYAFGFSLFFIVVPSILVAVLEYNFIKKTYGKKVSCKTLTFRTLLNIPFQLTVIWYHCQLTYTYFKSWFDDLRGVQTKTNATSTTQWYDPTTLERSRGASLSSLNELDIHSNAIDKQVNDNAGLANFSGSMDFLQPTEAESSNKKKSWWKRLAREQWLSHLNKLKLSESMLESLPQLLINLYLIIRHPNTAAIQYVSAVLSYLSLCGGVVRYDKTKKDNEADRWMVDRTLLHSRAFYTRLEWPQLLFISIYKGSFLAARSLAFVYFVIYLTWYILIPIMLHWSVLLIYLVYKWYPDFSKVTRQLRQADNKYRAYVFLSRDFMSVLLESLVGIFIHMRPYFHALLDQPYCFMFWYYLAYVIENVTLFTLPGIVSAMNKNDAQLGLYRYYPLLATELALNVIGAVFCAVYYVGVHKTRAFTAHAYPAAARVLFCCFFPTNPDDECFHWLPVRKDWTVCKQVETSELFFLTKDQLETFRQTYNTIVRNDRRRSRAIECFVDDRCRIFYAPRSKMKKITMKAPDETTLRPSYRKLKTAHERSLAANGEMGASVEDVRRESNNREETTPYLESSTSAEADNATLPRRRVSIDAYVDESDTPLVHTPPYEQPVDRPVRKPRVKSLRGANPMSTSSKEEKKITPNLSREPQSANQNPRSPTSPTPIPLPRKTDKSMAEKTKTSPVYPDSEEVSSQTSTPLSDPRIIQCSYPRHDDAGWSSPRRHQEFDDSTYRVRKSEQKTDPKMKQNPKQKHQEESDVENSATNELLARERGEIVTDSSGWHQTWI